MTAQFSRRACIRGVSGTYRVHWLCLDSRAEKSYQNLCLTISLGYDRAAVMKRIADATIMTEPEESLTMGAVCHVNPRRPIGAGTTKTTKLLTSRIAPMDSFR